MEQQTLQQPTPQQQLWPQRTSEQMPQGEPTAAADQVRVTPEELALAAAALEARQAAEANRRASTIALGDAVHQLGLNTTSEALLSEVEKIRVERAAMQQHAAIVRKRRRALIGTGALLSLSVIAALSAMVVELRHALKVALHPVPSLSIQSLAQVPDHRPFHVDFSILASLAQGASPTQISVDTRVESSDAPASSGMFNKEWELIKENGKIVVRGWTTAEEALKAANEQPMVVYSNRPAWLPAANIVPVQLPLYRFQERGATEYTAAGEEVKNNANGIVDGIMTNGAEELILQHLRADPEFPYTVYDENSGKYSDGLRLYVAGEVAHLRGSVKSAASAQRALNRVNEAIRKYGLKTSVSNELNIDKQ